MNKRPLDPIDRSIVEGGLRIKDVYIDRSIDLLLLVLNNGQVVRSSVSDHERLRSASPAELQRWKLIAGGTGITWPKLDEDLSLRGFIQAESIERTLRTITAPPGRTGRPTRARTKVV
ncbi:MAG: DUF2442 domain-containing protein [Flavobacteriales bacterium]|nr:DUF2442 domain-containing protein [Flavobacteriales bacterium]